MVADPCRDELMKSFLTRRESFRRFDQELCKLHKISMNEEIVNFVKYQQNQGVPRCLFAK